MLAVSDDSRSGPVELTRTTVTREDVYVIKNDWLTDNV